MQVLIWSTPSVSNFYDDWLLLNVFKVFKMVQGKVEAEEADATAVDGEAVAKPAAAKPHAAVVDEEEAMASIMMTTKNKRLYEGIQKREAAKKARVMELERRKSQPAKS